MKPIFILATSHMQYIDFCRNFDLNPMKDAHYISDNHEQLLGLSPHAHRPLLLLEGWQYNPNYKVALGNFLNFFSILGKFEPYFISEGEIWNENFIL